MAHRRQKMMCPAAALMAFMLQLTLLATAAASCPAWCGHLSVPYPFGIAEGCYFPGFNLTCDTTGGRVRLLIGGAGGTLEVVDISLANSTVLVMDTAGAVEVSNHGVPGAEANGTGTWAGLGTGALDGPFVVSGKRNRFVLTGCNVQATLLGEDGSVIVGCSTFCTVHDRFASVINPEDVPACDSVGCCEMAIPIGRPSYMVKLAGLDPNQEMDTRLPIQVRIAETGWFEGASAELLNNSSRVSSRWTAVPVVLEWAMDSNRSVSSMRPHDTLSHCRLCWSTNNSCYNVMDNYRTGYVCQCPSGFRGNPYLKDGCQDIDECARTDRCSGECINTPGGYLCCPRGSRGNPEDGCVKSSIAPSVGIGIGSGAGLLLLVLAAFLVTRKLKHERAKVLKKKFFRQNRGHLLQQLVSQKADIAERMIIPLVELEKATNNLRQSSRDRRWRARHGVQRDHVRPARRGDQEVQDRGLEGDRRVHQRGSHPLADQPSKCGEALRVLPRDGGAPVGV